MQLLHCTTRIALQPSSGGGGGGSSSSNDFLGEDFKVLPLFFHSSETKGT